MTEENALIWLDLGISYLAHSLNTSEKNLKHTLLDYALAVAQHCISIDPDNSRHWNLIGNISMQQGNIKFSVSILLIN